MNVISRASDGRMIFWCPGCGEHHGVYVEREQRPRWGWNDSMDRPTFTPSILVTWEWGEKREKKVCHSFVTDGQIRFLGDCTHKLAGQTVPLPPIER